MTARINVAGLALAALLGSTGAFAQSDSPFAPLAGLWSGVGTVSMTDGHSEKIRCKASYEVVPSGIIVRQSLRCASDSYKFEVKSSLQADGHNILGTWTESTKNVGGDVTGTINGGQLTISVSSAAFSASLGVTTRGNSQTVSMKPSGTEIESVQIEMKRA